jgi:hypothetical protein
LRSASADASSTPGSYDQYAQRFADAQTQERIAWTAIAVGGALVAGGVARYILHARAVARETAAWWIAPSWAGVVTGGHF